MRTIFHVDVNSAFLSWSALKQLQEDPDSVDLHTIPSAVGGDVETRHGIITAKSIPAKKYGIQTGEPVVKALAKCPSLVLVKSDFQTYRMYSSRFMAILRTYTPYVEQASIDEAYLDVSDLINGRPNRSGSTVCTEPKVLAREIADRIKNELSFTVNVGISSNKFLAKTASDFSKPDKIHTLFPSEIKDKLWPMPIGKLHGCGHATASKLQSVGISTIGSAAGADLPLLQSILGIKSGLYIHDRANGIDHSEVNYQEREAKSYSNETTTAEDITRENFGTLAVPLLNSLCKKVSSRLQKDHVYGSTVGVMVKTGNFKRHSRQETLTSSTNDEDEIFNHSLALLQDFLSGPDGLFAHGEVIRLIGVSIANLDNGENRQMSLTEWSRISEDREKQEAKKKKLDLMIEQVQQRYGADAIKKGQ